MNADIFFERTSDTRRWPWCGRQCRAHAFL